MERKDREYALEIVKKSEKSVLSSERRLKKSREELNELKRFLIKYDALECLPIDLNGLKKAYEDFTSKFYRVPDFGLFDKCAKREYVYIRKCFFRTAKKNYTTSKSALGRLCNVDHNTVTHAIDNEIIDSELTNIENELRKVNLF